jgi:glycosyltransferase involved in cell wall biosynthesis
MTAAQPVTAFDPPLRLGGAPLHIVHGVLALDVGGLERIVLNLIREACRRGHRATVVCVERAGRLAAEAGAAGAAVLSLDKPPGRSPVVVEEAAKVLRELAPDVIHTHQIGAAWYLGQAAQRLNIPVVHTEHGNHIGQARGLRQVIKTRLFLRDASRFVAQFCCVSDEIAAAVSRWWTVPRSKVATVPNGIPTDTRPDLPTPHQMRDTLRIPRGAPVVGTVGRLSEVKRQDLLLRALAVLRRSVPDLRCLIVGDGPERGPLEALARDLGVSESVHFAGYQPCPEQFLRAMDVFALTSRSEGFPVSLLEAWLAGVPVVCSAVGGIPAVVAHEIDGLLFPPGDELELVAALGRLISNAGLRQRLAEAGRRAVHERYSLDRMADEYERRYRQVIAARVGGR